MALWAMTCGMNTEDDWASMVTVAMQQRAADARANASREARKE
jgi:hypothetical protein